MVLEPMFSPTGRVCQASWSQTCVLFDKEGLEPMFSLTRRTCQVSWSLEPMFSLTRRGCQVSWSQTCFLSYKEGMLGFFQKQNILPLVIQKRHNGSTYKVFFPMPVLCKIIAEKTNLCSLTQRQQSGNYKLFPRHIARYPYPQTITEVALFRKKPSQVIVISHSILFQSVYLILEEDQLLCLVFQENHYSHS